MIIEKVPADINPFSIKQCLLPVITMGFTHEPQDCPVLIRRFNSHNIIIVYADDEAWGNMAEPYGLMFGGVVFQDDTACWIEGNLNTRLRDVTSFIP